MKKLTFEESYPERTRFIELYEAALTYGTRLQYMPEPERITAKQYTRSTHINPEVVAMMPEPKDIMDLVTEQHLALMELYDDLLATRNQNEELKENLWILQKLKS